MVAQKTPRKHVAASGARQGEYVNCYAGISCRVANEEAHISEAQFGATKIWLVEQGEKKTSREVTPEDVNGFLNDPDAIEYVQQWQNNRDRLDKQDLDKRAEMRARNEARRRKLDEDIKREREAAAARPQTSVPGIVSNALTTEKSNTHLTQKDWVELQNKARELRVIVHFNESTSQLLTNRDGSQEAKVKDLYVTGPSSTKDEMLNYLRRLETRQLTSVELEYISSGRLGGVDMENAFEELRQAGCRVSFRGKEKNLFSTTYYGVKVTGPFPVVKRWQNWIKDLAAA